MTTQFAGGAAGSIIGMLSYHSGGWAGTARTGIGVGIVLLGLLEHDHAERNVQSV